MSLLRINHPGEDNLYRQRVFKLVEQLKLSGTIRTTAWFYKAVKKGRFKRLVHDYRNEQEVLNFCNQIDSIITILNSVYDNKWDFHLEPVFDDFIPNTLKYFKLKVIIHYPEFNIINSNGLSHTIKDLLVSFSIMKYDGTDSEGNYQAQYLPRQLTGTRATLSYEEWFVGYQHSHLRVNKPSDFYDVFDAGDFCTGSGEINEVFATLWENGYSEEHFEMLLHTVNTVAEWESLEGTPHIKMQSIGIGKKQSLSDMSESRTKDYYSSLVTYMQSHYPSIDADFVYSDNRFKIKQNEKFDNFLKQFIIDFMPDYWDKILVKKINGNYVGYSHPKIYSQEQMEQKFTTLGEKPYTIIQNLVLDFEVLPYSGELPDINLYNVHPKLINYAAREFEKQLYNKSVRESTIEKYYQNNNA